MSKWKTKEQVDEDEDIDFGKYRPLRYKVDKRNKKDDDYGWDDD